MAQLWGGRFTKETDQMVYDFNASILFDQKLIEEDITGSKAHVTMLCKKGIVTEEEKTQIIKGLESILKDALDGTLPITTQYEDVHSFVEANLIDRIGDAGKKLHTGRSRNDQVALDMRMYVRKHVKETDALLKQLLEVILKTMEANLDTYMPAERERREAVTKAEGEKKASILEAEGKKAAAILTAEAEKESAILRAEAEKEKKIKEAEGQAEAIRKVQEANAEGIRMIREAGADEAVLKIKSLEAFAAAANGNATKIIIPSEIQGIAGLAASAKEILDK